MLSIFLTILPVFIIMGIGWIAVKIGYLSDTLSEHLNAFTVRLAVPVLLFRAMISLDFSQAFNIPTLLGFYTGGIISFITGILLARTIWKRRPGESVAIGFCALFSNTVLLGIPIMQRVYGEVSLTPVFGIIALHAGTMYTIGLLTMEMARADGRPFSQTIRTATKSILSNTLMIGVLLGIAVNLSGITLPEVILSPIDMIASAAIPVALIGIGAVLTRYKIKAELSEALMVSSLSLLLQPLIAFIITHMIFELPIELVRAAVIVGAMPPGMNVYIFAAMFDRAVGLSASVIVIATSLSIFTISAWIWFLTLV